MKNSKLIQLLTTFDAREWQRFDDFVRSPYFNKNKAVSRLCRFLKEQTPELEFSRAQAVEATYPSEIKGNFDYTMHKLLCLAEEFLAIEKFRSKDVEVNRYALMGYSEKGLAKHYKFLLKIIYKRLNASLTGTEVLSTKFQLAEVKAHHSLTTSPTHPPPDEA